MTDFETEFTYEATYDGPEKDILMVLTELHKREAGRLTKAYGQKFSKITKIEKVSIVLVGEA